MKDKKTRSKQSLVDLTQDARIQRGQIDGNVMFPIAPTQVELPSSYMEWLAELKSNIAKTRLKVVLNANSDMVLLYWSIGGRILEKQKTEGWGARIIDRLAFDLQETFSDMKGFSPRNLKYMRAFSSAWPNIEVVQEVLAQLPWYHNIALLEKLTVEKERLWYARKAYEHGWSRNILAMQIEIKAHLRQGKAQNNFPATLPATDSDLAVQVEI